MPTRHEARPLSLCALGIGIVLAHTPSLAGDVGAGKEKHYLAPPPPVSTEDLSRDERKIAAAVNQGNSGGPLVNLKGEIVGIVSRILTTTGGSVGLGFAVASNEIKKLPGEEAAPWIGANALSLGPDPVRALHIPYEGALLVQNVVEGSPAERAGVRGGDLPALIGSTRLVLGGDVILAIEEARDKIHLEPCL